MFIRCFRSKRLRRSPARARSGAAGLNAFGLFTFLLVVGGAGTSGPLLHPDRGDRVRGVTAVTAEWSLLANGSCETPAIEPRFEIDLAGIHVAEWRQRLLRTPPRLLDAYLSRPDPWMDELLPILRAHDVPPGFLYLALVESGMDPEARSPADAVGLWQFTPSTGRAYGLRIEDGTDDRTDERLATRAAGRYLRDLFDDFGSWELAAAAYNAGPGRVQQAMESSGTDDFWDLVEGKHLPPETRAYVPKFIAVVQLAAERAEASAAPAVGFGLD